MQVSDALLRSIKRQGWEQPVEYVQPIPQKKTKPKPKPLSKPSHALSSTARLLLIHLRKIARNGRINTSTKGLAGWLHRTSRTVRRCLAELEAAGLIRRSIRRGLFNLYAGLDIELLPQEPRKPRADIPNRTSKDSILEISIQRRTYARLSAERLSKSRLQYRLMLE